MDAPTPAELDLMTRVASVPLGVELRVQHRGLEDFAVSGPNGPIGVRTAGAGCSWDSGAPEVAGSLVLSHERPPEEIVRHLAQW